MIAQAAAIQDRGWWHAPRRVLSGLSPADWIELIGARAGAALLDLAASDAADLQREAAGVGAPAAEITSGRNSRWVER